VYGGQAERERNVEAARLLGAELEKAVNEAVARLKEEENADVVVGLSPIKEKARESTSPKPRNINIFFGCGGRI
jgi:hypothetical protein